MGMTSGLEIGSLFSVLQYWHETVRPSAFSLAQASRLCRDHIGLLWGSLVPNFYPNPCIPHLHPSRKGTPDSICERNVDISRITWPGNYMTLICPS